MKFWAITIPKTIKWEDYQKELDAVADRRSVLNYKTRYFPKEMKRGDVCYVVWNGKVRGWMSIVGMVEYPEGFVCETTGKRWEAGKYIQRSGRFYDWEDFGPELKGFRGIKKVDEKEANIWFNKYSQKAIEEK